MKLKTQSGSILAAVIILGTVLSIAGLTVVIVSGNISNQTQAYRDENRRVITAESGLSLALGAIKASGIIAAANYTIPATNGESVNITVNANGWVRSQIVVPVPTVEMPLIWTQMVKCSVSVRGTPPMDSLNIYNRTDSAIVLSYP